MDKPPLGEKPFWLTVEGIEQRKAEGALNDLGRRISDTYAARIAELGAALHRQIDEYLEACAAIEKAEQQRDALMDWLEGLLKDCRNDVGNQPIFTLDSELEALLNEQEQEG